MHSLVGGLKVVFVRPQAMARRRLERKRPHRCSAVPRGHKERPECMSLKCLRWTCLCLFIGAKVKCEVFGLMPAAQRVGVLAQTSGM